MTALRKHIIPLQKEDLELAFNIQSHDTIKYNNKNINIELDSAITDAIKLTETKKPENTVETLDDSLILGKMGLAGFLENGNRWFNTIQTATKGTEFKGFWHADKGFIAFVGKVDDNKDLKNYMYNLISLINNIEMDVKYLEEKYERATKSTNPNSEEKYEKATKLTDAPQNYYENPRNIFEALIKSQEGLLEELSTIFIGFITNSEVNLNTLRDSAKKILNDLGVNERYKIACLHDDKIQFGEVIVDFASKNIWDED